MVTVTAKSQTLIISQLICVTFFHHDSPSTGPDSTTRSVTIFMRCPVNSMADQQCRCHAIHAAGVFVHTLITGAIAFSGPLYTKLPYHTSILTGKGWILELLNGHLEWMHTELGMCVPVFRQLVLELLEIGLGPSRHVSLEKQLAIFLYASVTGLSIWHLGERFQHLNKTISKWVHSGKIMQGGL